MLRPLLAICGSMLAATLSSSALSGATASSSLVSAESTSSALSVESAAARGQAIQAFRVPSGTSPAAPGPRKDLDSSPSLRSAATGPAEPPLRIALAKALLVVPRGCAALDRSFDLLIHFHGAYTTTEPQLMKSGINAVYLIKNLGNGSGAYEDAFGYAGAFRAEIESVRALVQRKCGGPERSVGRIALSGWSAGYGAIYRILARSQDAARVDAVLLADGMHVGFEPGSHKVRGAAMTPFLDFAQAATRGEKLMAVTHSAIVPPTYASTTQTARFIVARLNLASAPEAGLLEPRAGMLQTSNDMRGDLHVTGYAGGDAHAHCDHLYAISTTLWSRLRDRWMAH